MRLHALSTLKPLAIFIWMTLLCPALFAAPYYLTGQILDVEWGAPVNGATVQIDNGAVMAFADNQGRFYLYGVAPTMHKLQTWGIAHEYAERIVYMPDGKSYDVGPIYIKKIDGVVFGKLVDSITGEPLVRATVQIDGGKIWRTQTDQFGNYLFYNVDRVPHSLQCWGYAYTYFQKGFYLNPQGSLKIDDISLSVIPNAVRGQVLNAVTKRPIVNATVQYDGGGAGMETKTNADGRFVLCNIPAGYHQLQVWGLAYNFVGLNFHHAVNAAEILGTIELMPIGGSISGRVVDATNGLPVLNATVQINGGAGVDSWKTTTDSNGEYILYNISDGVQKIQTWGYGYRFQEYDFDFFSENTNINDIALIPDPNTFTGRVLDADTRLPIEKSLIIMSDNNQWVKSESFSDGRFVVLNVRPETDYNSPAAYDITAEALDNDLVYLRSIHPGEGQNVNLGDFLLPKWRRK
ncbi:MAG TPA: carboxypeptidase regulatory-like domain-containing protein [Candidatus Sumerlaeota bacterium]|nr:MAG: hypothetical protein BWY12_01095 [candidate division BRC1 bacterium ADurb.Bin183]HOE63983.1 carboxypeptidase regulatory-like domain-containing protein [Candidatus Sumerlaeota bacterium]HRR30620.1 carboxypeptidase regulatory-like domain-containing protein [Candidatus Sumerlaeia bacterium]HON50809.1 carboxypeptidase regulatory-like domain-containing protein [Candidatus Sumerlaeota bacterium]HOR65503.1 carboxypeptidase regulatory-like domain-containing protein [Candidatus Sumerlaeota bacte